MLYLCAKPAYILITSQIFVLELAWVRSWVGLWSYRQAKDRGVKVKHLALHKDWNVQEEHQPREPQIVVFVSSSSTCLHNPGLCVPYLFWGIPMIPDSKRMPPTVATIPADNLSIVRSYGLSSFYRPGLCSDLSRPCSLNRTRRRSWVLRNDLHVELYEQGFRHRWYHSSSFYNTIREWSNWHAW